MDLSLKDLSSSCNGCSEGSADGRLDVGMHTGWHGAAIF